MEREKQLIREFLESMSSLMDNVSNLARSKKVFIDEIDELRDNLEYTKEKIAFDIHNSGEYLPDGHPYFEKNSLKHIKNHLYICTNYLWVFYSVSKKWVKTSRVFARQCDITGEGMNKGFYIENESMYIKHRKDLRKYIEENTDYKNLSEAHDDDYWYYTEWECPLDYQYKIEFNSKTGEDVLVFMEIN